jgi:hypothetical protein
VVGVHEGNPATARFRLGQARKGNIYRCPVLPNEARHSQNRAQATLLLLLLIFALVTGVSLLPAIPQPPVPRKIVFLNALPLLGTGKIDCVTLKHLAESA